MCWGLPPMWLLGRTPAAGGRFQVAEIALWEEKKSLCRFFPPGDGYLL